MNPEKLAKLQAAAQNRSKGQPRRNIKVHRPTSSGDDKKLQAAIEKLGVSTMYGVEEVNMFKEDGSVLHFRNAKVHSAATSNTYIVYGRGEEKELTELVPSILSQLGPDSLATLRKLAESYQQSAAGKAALGGDDDDEVPDLVDSFDKADIEESAEEAKKEEATA
ncbi:Nascent polypeptide-associated complex subunit beta [Actinomortierella wolfii]|nr:Nascent polypeptide-associated complex subunit beta [Actinomortierella wolfii]KAG0226227.1 Nascent polypeptide-associated complex subunit beta [Actinomortierella wolfii]